MRRMDYGLGETIGLLRESVRGFALDEIAPLAAAIPQKDFFSPELWREMGVLGLLGITVSAEDGGAGMGYLEHVVVMEEISRVSAALGLAYSAHSNLCVNQLRLHGTEEQKRRYLPGLISGELVGALAMGWAEAGPDVASPDLSAEKQGTLYNLNGVTRSCCGRPDADVLIVYAGTSSPQEPLAISAFIVEKNTPGLQVSDQPDTQMLPGESMAELRFADCRIAEENLLGEADRSGQVLLSGLDCERLILAGGALGVMAACLDLLLPEMQHHKHKQLCRTARELRLLEGAIAEMYTTLCACRSYVYTVARAADGGTSVRKDGTGTLLFVAERAIEMVLDAARLLGGKDQHDDYSLSRLHRDARLFAGGEAAAKSRRLQVARELFPEPGR